MEEHLKLAALRRPDRGGVAAVLNRTTDDVGDQRNVGSQVEEFPLVRDRAFTLTLDLHSAAMLSVADMVEQIRSAIAQVRVAAIRDGDPRRMAVAEQLEQQFAGITYSQELRAAARGALRLYGGGMRSFQDTATTEVSDAVHGLHEALRQAV